MKPNYKFLRVLCGAVVGSALWAGCSTQRDVCGTQQKVICEPSGANYAYERRVALDPRADFNNWSVDTHPEWRNGWNMAFPNPPCYATAAEVQNIFDEPAGAAPESR